MDRKAHPWRIGELNTGDLFIDFANSELFDGKGNLTDRLLDPAWRRAILLEWGLGRHGPLEEDDLPELIELRSAIRSIAERLAAGRAPPARQLEQVSAVLASHPVRFRLSGRGGLPRLEVIPLAGRRTGIIPWEIAMSAARFLAAGEPDRLKLCINPGCRWIFHDRTRNRGRRWCGPCGNADKVRRFRERQRLARTGQR